MATKKSEISRGSVIYDESIVTGIVAIAVTSVEGVVVAPNKKGKVSTKDYIKIVSEKDGIYVSVTVSVHYGYNIPDIAYNIQYGVKSNVEAMTKYKITKVDVHVAGVVFDEKAAEATDAEA